MASNGGAYDIDFDNCLLLDKLYLLRFNVQVVLVKIMRNIIYISIIFISIFILYFGYLLNLQILEISFVFELTRAEYTFLVDK